MNRLIKFLTIITTISLLSISCEKWIDPKLNIDPDSPVDPKMDLILSGTQGSMAYVLGGFDITGITSMWMKYITGTDRQAKKIGEYSLVEKDVENAWNSIYTSILENLEIIIEKSQVEGQKSPYYEGIAKVMKAYTLGIATQLWGDIPVKEALLGEDNTKPSFDSHDTVYAYIQRLLDEAIIALNLPSDSNHYALNRDSIYKNDVHKWSKAAHTLKLRYWLHLSKVKGNSVYQQILDYYNADSTKFFTSNSDDFQFNFGETVLENNPLYQFNELRGGDCSSSLYFKDAIDQNNYGIQDNRKDVFISEDLFAGLFYGDKASPVVFISYTELMFILAEAQYMTQNEAGAINSIYLGVKSSLDKSTGILDAIIPNMPLIRQAFCNTYLSVVSTFSGSEIYDEIFKQKYLAQFMNPETFVDWRRTGYPDFSDKLRIPRRFPYSTDERIYNPNTPEINSLFDRMWIDPE